MFSKIFTILCLVLLLPSYLWPATYYVDSVSGLDTNNGSSESVPWKTIAKVNATVYSPGDKVLFKRGALWREQLTISSSGVAGNPITFSAYGSGELPVITGANQVASCCTYLTSPNIYQCPVSIRPFILSLDSSLGTSKTSIANLVTNNDWFWSAGTLYIFSTTNPATRSIESGARTHAVFGSSKHYITVQYLNLKGSNGRLLRDNSGNGWNISNNVVELGASDTSGDTGGAIAINTATDLLIAYNIIQNVSEDGIMTYLCNNVTVSHNTIINANGLNSDSIQITGANPYLIDSNFCDQTLATVSGKGNIISTGGNNGVVQFNTVIGGLYGISISDSNLIVRNNVSTGHIASNGWGYGIAGNPSNQAWSFNISNGDNLGFWGPNGPFTGMLFSNNVVYNAIKGGFQFDCTTGTFSGTVKNSIFYGTTPLLFDIANAGTVSSDYNLIGPDKVHGIFYAGTYYDTLAAYKAARGKDAHSLNSNPLFVNPAAGDFHLQIGSPAINAGVTEIGAYVFP